MSSNTNQENEKHLILILFSKDAVCKLKQASHNWEGGGSEVGKEKKQRRPWKERNVSGIQRETSCTVKSN